VSNEAAVIIPIEAIDETPSLSSEGLPEGFVIQMGVFSNFNNGERLRLQLISDGYKAYSRKSSSENGGRMTIFVGPWLDRNRVEAFREELNQKYQVLGLIKRYELESL
jgi:DedD protein